VTTDPDRAVAAHYDRFPYPPLRRMHVPTPPAHALGRLGFLLRRRSSLRAERIWVAGCGTQQGARFGLMFPDADVLATDVSAEALGAARQLADSVGASVRFAQRDLRSERGPFDLVACTGVVHHLADPVGALRALRDALAPDGAAIVMVYSRAHRAPLDPVRHLIEALEPSEDEAFDVACAALAASADPRCAPADRALLRGIWRRRDSDRATIADTLIHPRESSYDVPALRTLLRDAGLRFVSWHHPAEWKLAHYCSDPALLERAAALGPDREAELVYHLANVASPSLDVLVERDDAPERAPWTREERLAMRMTVAGPTRDLDIRDGQLRGESALPPWQVANGAIQGTTPTGRVWMVSEALLPTLEACDGTRTLGELATSDEIADALLALGPDEAGLLAPAQSAPAA